MKQCLAFVSAVLVTAAMTFALVQDKALKTHAGEVVSVDAASSRIVLKHDSGAQMTVPVASDAKITRGGQPIKLEDIKPGEKLSCKCDESAGKCNVKEIEVRE